MGVKILDGNDIQHEMCKDSVYGTCLHTTKSERNRKGTGASKESRSNAIIHMYSTIEVCLRWPLQLEALPNLPDMLPKCVDGASRLS